MKTAIQLILFLLPTLTFGASFDCSKAATNTELAICDNPQLSILDEMMALSYRQLLKDVTDKKTLKNEQLRFLDENKKCAASLQCLRQSYISRILAIHTRTVDLGRYLEARNWIALPNQCSKELSEARYKKGDEIITLVLDCRNESSGRLFDIAVETTGTNNPEYRSSGDLAVYVKGNNRIKIDINTKSPQIIYLSVGLNSKGQCDVGAIDCWLDSDFYTIKTPFGYQVRQREEFFDYVCVIDIEVIRQKLKVTYRNGICGTGVDNRFVLQYINGIYSPR